MAFEISQIINTYLKDAATIVDKNNDGVISNGAEISVFMQKAENIKEHGLCSEEDYREILNFCPRETTIANGQKVQQGTDKYEPNEAKQNEYKAELNKLVDEELKNKGLEKNSENITKAIEIVKQKKEINIQIKILEKQIEELKQQKPEDKYKNKIMGATITSTGVGIGVGAYTGSKLGTAFLGGFPMGTIAGAVIGGIAAGIAGAVGGNNVAKTVISKEELENAKQEIETEIKNKNTELDNLKTRLENL